MTQSAFASRLAALPREIRWLLGTVVFIGLFFAWDSSLGSVARAWNDESKAIEAQVSAVRTSADLVDRLDALDDAIIGLGRVTKPGGEADGRTRLTNVIVQVLQNDAYRTDELSFDLSGGGDKLREDASRGIVRPGNRVTRLTGTLKFESSPEDAIAIIADLERHEDIEAIRKVTITKIDSRSGAKVSVNLVMEAWVQVTASKKKR